MRDPTLPGAPQLAWNRRLVAFGLLAWVASAGFAAEAVSRFLHIPEAIVMHEKPDDTRLRPIEIEWKSMAGITTPTAIEEVRIAGQKAPRGTQCTVSENDGRFTGELHVPESKDRPAGTWRFEGATDIAETVAQVSAEQGERKVSGSATFLSVYSIGKEDGAALRVWLPPGSSPVRGLFIWGNGAKGDGRGKVLDERWRAFCSHYHFAFVATSQYGLQMRGGEGRRLLRQLAEVAKMSGRPELTTVPVIFSGNSNGGQMAWEFNAAFPERTIAISVSKGGVYETFDDLPSAAARTAVMMVIGEKDEPRRAHAILRLFNVHRKQPRPWALAIERGADHGVGHSEAVWLPFFAHVIEERLQASASPDAAPALRDVNLSSGWIADQRGALRPAKDVSVDEQTKGSWLPDVPTALAYTALMAHGRDLEIVATPTTNVVQAGEILQLRLKKFVAGEWKLVELWVDGQKSKVLTSDDQKLELQSMEPGVHSAVAIGRREDGGTSFSAPYAWIVKGTAKAE